MNEGTVVIICRRIVNNILIYLFRALFALLEGNQQPGPPKTHAKPHFKQSRGGRFYLPTLFISHKLFNPALPAAPLFSAGKTQSNIERNSNYKNNLQSICHNKGANGSETQIAFGAK
jgi:hypothetical protein